MNRFCPNCGYNWTEHTKDHTHHETQPLTLSPQDWKKIELSLRGAQVPVGTNEVLTGLSDGSLEVCPPAKEK